MIDCTKQEKKIFVSVMNIEYNMSLRSISDSLCITNALLLVGNLSVCQECPCDFGFFPRPS
jgi:hypothetical protein